MKLFLPLLLLALMSCGVRKHVVKTEYVKDSTTERALQQHVRMLEKEIQERTKDSATLVVTEVVFEECDTAKPPATVVLSDGKLQSVTGQLKSVKQQLSAEVSERYSLISQVDSLATLLEQERHNVKVQEVVKERKVARPFPWLWLAIAFIAGCVFWSQFGAWIKLRIFGIKSANMNILPLLLLGTWPVGLLILIGAAYFFYMGWRASRSGSKQQTPRGTIYSDKNVPIYKTGWFYLGCMCVAALVAYLLIQLNEA